MNVVRKLLIAVIIIGVICITAGAALFLVWADRIPRLPADLKLLASSPPTEVYSRDGDLLKRIGGRVYVPLERISPVFLRAVVAVEDKRFHHHRGIDHLALMRALWLNVRHFGRARGGSTITQQLAKNLFFTFKRSWKRKLLEAFAALAIEDRFSKNQILEAYVNLVYYGRYAYGVEQAAQLYFGKSAVDLELHEAALLAGLPNSPSRFDPLLHLDRAKRRQRIVLNLMSTHKMISARQADSAYALPLKLVRTPPLDRRGSFPLDYAIESAGAAVGEDLVSYGGVRIITTIDPLLQDCAERILAHGLSTLEKRLEPLPPGDVTRLEGALVAVEVATGDIVALVGGRDYRQSPYNRAVRALRQPGSAFKPVIYLTALDRLDVTPATVMEDRPLKLPIDRHRTWSPVNFDHRYRGPVCLKWALMKSINTISAQLIYRETPREAVKTARLLGIKTPLEPFLALALGAQGVTPLEMADVFATLARMGVSLEPTLISRIEGRGRGTLFEHFTAGETRFAPRTVYQLVDMMLGVIDGGTGSVVRRRGFKGIAIGKTGTSSDFRDSWFCGATPNLAVVVWVGYDDNRPMKFSTGEGVTAASGAAPIWADFMIQVTAGESIVDFPRPPGIGRFWIHPFTGTVSREPVEGWIPAALKVEDAERLLQEQSAQWDSTAADTMKPDTARNDTAGADSTN